MTNVRSRFLLKLRISIKAIQKIFFKELYRLAWMLLSTVKLVPVSPPFYLLFFSACKSLLNKKSDSAKVRLSRHLSALFCSATLCPVSPLLADPFFAFCSFSVPLSLKLTFSTL